MTDGRTDGQTDNGDFIEPSIGRGSKKQIRVNRMPYKKAIKTLKFTIMNHFKSNKNYGILISTASTLNSETKKISHYSLLLITPYRLLLFDVMLLLVLYFLLLSIQNKPTLFLLWGMWKTVWNSSLCSSSSENWEAIFALIFTLSTAYGKFTKKCFVIYC